MNAMVKYVLIGALSVGVGSAASCSAWDMIKPDSKGLSVDTEIVVGDKEESYDVELAAEKTETHNTADTIKQTYNTINEGYPMWVLILLVLGWMMPTPPKIWAGIKKISLPSFFRRKK